MPLKTLFTIIFGAILFTACTKSGGSNNSGNNNGGGNDTSANNPPANFLLHTSYSASFGNGFSEKTSDTFNYNKSANTITVFEIDTSSGSIFPDTITCKLKKDSVIITHSRTTFKQTYYLNNTHTQIDSLLIINSGQSIIYRYDNTLDNAGELISRKATGITYTNGVAGTPTEQTTTYTWSNGNMVKSANNFEVFNYSYNESILAAQPDPLMIIYEPDVYLNYSKNVEKSISFTYTASNIVISIATVYDDKGRTIQSTGSGTDGTTFMSNDTYY